MKSWDDLTELEQAHNIYSDMYKDVYGFRPFVDVSNWRMEDFDKEFEFLRKEMEIQLIEDKKIEERNIAEFENTVTLMIRSGAKDRNTAIRWLHEAEDTDGDNDYLCFLKGIPYGYIKL